MSCFVAFQRNNENLYQSLSSSSDFIIFIKRNVINSRSNVFAACYQVCVTVKRRLRLSSQYSQCQTTELNQRLIFKINAPFEGHRSEAVNVCRRGALYRETIFFLQHLFSQKVQKKEDKCILVVWPTKNPIKTRFLILEIIHSLCVLTLFRQFL